MTSLYCSFCGTMTHELDSQKCSDCGAAFCPQCASQLRNTGSQIKCPCGSINIKGRSSGQNSKSETLEQIFDLKRSLKQVAYRPVLVLKRTGHLESRLRSFRKQFLIPGNQIDKIFLETKKIENFTLSEFQEYSAKLNRLYRNLMGLNSSFTDHRNFSLQLTLFQKQIRSFDQTVQDKLLPIYDLIEQMENKCDQFEEMARHLGRCFDAFVFVPGELVIGYFANIELQNSRIRKTTIDIVITTDRIVLLKWKRFNLRGQRTKKFDEFPPEDLIDVQKTKIGFFKRDKLQITTIQHDYELRTDGDTLMRIFDGLQLSYYGRPSEIYVHEPFRDWSSEIYQEKILSGLNFHNNNNGSPEHSSNQNKEPDFVTGVLDDRLRDLRLRKLANEKALQELKEGRKKVSSRDYFDLIKQFELELAKINEAITELLVRTGKTNLLG
ncbi:MAG: zinc ribbon domain-containing protein [Candidatus Heimdallarchaeota archaeon]|nr:MAG: zinc ribbon domain-containing protein [Candidatus Heimdallarchaeota archaeon]